LVAAATQDAIQNTTSQRRGVQLLKSGRGKRVAGKSHRHNVKSGAF
jgi:hypothetical protein